MLFNNLVDRIIIGEKLKNGKEDLYKIKFILKNGEMIKDNLPNNKLKIGIITLDLSDIKAENGKQLFKDFFKKFKEIYDSV